MRSKSFQDQKSSPLFKKDNTITNYYQNIVQELDLGELTHIETIQTLWSGYGELVRLYCTKQNIIVKHIKLPKLSNHPKGWNTNLSHKRKLHSYQVEVKWYENFTKETNDRFRIPQGLKCFGSQNEWLIVMEDLATVGLKYTTEDASKNHLRSSLSWLANFHAYYMGKRSWFLWDIGTYWHLDTRPDELNALEDMELKDIAKKIDTILNSTRYQTIVHGDAKLANFCFNEDGSQCAAVDFQYVGHGCGIKDVIYFMSSSIEPEDCKKMQGWILDTYFEALKEAMEYYRSPFLFKDVEKEYKEMFYFAWADFLRFLKGWSSEHYKINQYSEDIKKEALVLLNKK